MIPTLFDFVTSLLFLVVSPAQGTLLTTRMVQNILFDGAMSISEAYGPLSRWTLKRE